ncbi:MAG: sulfatase [Candidatus Aminicenantia bacterium]
MEIEDGQKKEKNHHSFLAQLRKVTQDANVILLVIDAARPDHLSCNGYFRPTTPFLDKIAATGVNFKCAFTEFPGTRGSTATLFTGYSPEVTSLFKIGSRLSPKFTTLAQLFKSKGFYTAGFIANGNVSADFGFQKGFDYYSELHQKEEFSHTAQGFIPFLFPWLEKMKNKKFFLYLHFREPHAPYIPPSPFKGMFSENYQSKIDPNKDKKKINQGKIKIDEQDLNYFIARYDENLASVDSVIGQIIEKMKQLKIYQKTLLIVTSDHGESLSDHHHYFGHGIVLYDEGIRIPLIIHFPNDWLKGKTITSLVKNSDIFPTLAEIYELDIPNEFIDGKSFAPLLYNPDKEINSSIISRTHSSINGYGYSLRTKKYKLIYWLYTWQPPHIEYYDLEKDPYEKVNLFNQGNVVQDFYLTELKKYIKKQRQKRKFLRISPRYIKLKDLDRKTLDNLKALGYI